MLSKLSKNNEVPEAPQVQKDQLEFYGKNATLSNRRDSFDFTAVAVNLNNQTGEPRKGASEKRVLPV